MLSVRLIKKLEGIEKCTKEVESRVRLTPPARFGGRRTHAPWRCDGAYPTEERLGLQMKENLRGYDKLLKLWYSQNGRCPQCGQKITPDTGWHVHHHVWVVNGGDDSMANLVVMLEPCAVKMCAAERAAESLTQSEEVRRKYFWAIRLT